MFLLIMPVIIPFFKQAHIGMQGVYLLMSSFSISAFIMEVPSGYISDLFGRKNTLLISALIKGIGFSLFPLAKDINTLVIAEILLGIAVSLNSGTDVALIYDTCDQLADKFIAPGKVLGKSLSLITFGEGLSSLLASILLIYHFTLNQLAIISAITSWIPLIITLTLKEPIRKKMGHNHRENFKKIFTGMFKQSRILNLIILMSIFSSTGTLLSVWMYQKYWDQLGVPLVYFGFLWAGTNFTASFSSRVAHSVELKIGSSTLLLIIGILPIMGYLGMGLVDQLFGVLICLLFQICRGLGHVILKDALNKRVDSEFRATANSITQMGIRISFVSLGPVIGYFIDSRGMSFTCLILAAFYGVVFILTTLPLIKEKSSFIK